MDKQSTGIIVGVIVVGVGVLLVLTFRSSSVDFSRDVPGSESTTTIATAGGEQDLREAKMTITAKHAFRKGSHIIVGDIVLPSSCHVLDIVPAVAHDQQSATVHFTRSFTGTAPCSKPGEVSQRFRTTFVASGTAQIATTVDGQEAVLNLIEARPDEDLDQVEIYIKG